MDEKRFEVGRVGTDVGGGEEAKDLDVDVQEKE